MTNFIVQEISYCESCLDRNIFLGIIFPISVVKSIEINKLSLKEYLQLLITVKGMKDKANYYLPFILLPTFKQTETR